MRARPNLISIVLPLTLAACVSTLTTVNIDGWALMPVSGKVSSNQLASIFAKGCMATFPEYKSEYAFFKANGFKGFRDGDPEFPAQTIGNDKLGISADIGGYSIPDVGIGYERSCEVRGPVNDADRVTLDTVANYLGPEIKITKRFKGGFFADFTRDKETYAIYVTIPSIGSLQSSEPTSECGGLTTCLRWKDLEFKIERSPNGA